MCIHRCASLADGWVSGDRVIVEEDRRVIENLEPAVPFENSTADFSVKADSIQLCYRRNLKEWEGQGWQFPPVPLATSPEPAGEDRVSRAG